MTPHISGINHYTIRCTAQQLPALAGFYTRVLGLSSGPRPEMDFQGAWLYIDARPVVHLMATLPVGVEADGLIDHIAFTGNDLAQMRLHLAAEGIPFDEAPIAGWPLHQIFVRDPAGLKVEMTFSIQQPAVNK